MWSDSAVDYIVYHDVSYAAGAEANHVTVAAERLGPIVLVRDPNVPIVTPAGVGIVPRYSCAAPTGKGTGICLAVPEVGCNDQLCPDVWGGYFNRLSVVLGGGNDSLTLVRRTLEAIVWAGDGDDVLDVRNGVRDQVNCGPGADTVAADRVDTLDVTCEAVTRG